MIISNSHKFIMLTNPKAGGSTMYLTLEKLSIDMNRRDVNHFGHETCLEVYTDLIGAYKNYFKAAFVRNPYDRVYSAFLENLHFHHRYPPSTDFNQFIEENLLPENIPQNALGHCGEKPIGLTCHYMPQHLWTHYQGKQVIDFIGRLENFESDFRYFCERVNLHNVDIIHGRVRSNEAKELRHINMFNKNSIDRVNNIYAKDFEYFGYTML